MGKSRKASIAGVCILLAVVAVASFFIGYKVAVDKNKTSWTKEETYPARIMNVVKVQLLGEK